MLSTFACSSSPSSPRSCSPPPPRPPQATAPCSSPPTPTASRRTPGAATITVVRSDASGHGEVRYGVWYDQSAQPNLEYEPVSGRVDFEDGQREATFQIPIHDDGDVESDETVKLGIYGAYPMRLADPQRARLTIVDDDTIASDRDLLNPLALPVAPTNGNPLQGARFFVDEEWGLANRVADSLKHRDPGDRREAAHDRDQPETKRFGSWTPNPKHEIATFLQRAHATDPGAIPLISTYRLKHLACGHVSDSPAEVDAYKRWYQEFAQGIGNHPVVLFYEIDALITAPCLSHTGLKVRIDELRSAIATLSALPHAVVYVDAGAADAHDRGFMARMLQMGRRRAHPGLLHELHAPGLDEARRSSTRAGSCASSAAARTTWSTRPRTGAGR